jgi:predicted AAA+ superfamily ATPase
LRERVAAEPERRVVVVDEIQRVPELLSVVHALIEERQDLRFVLTGSSARSLRRQGVNLLGGRAIRRTLHPFMAAELGDRFRLGDAVAHGLVPLIVMAPQPEEAARAYAALYVQEEVKAEGLVRNLGAFARFLEAISFSHASVLNVTEVARECGVDRKTVDGYLGILDDLLVAFRLPVFTRRARRETSSHPKFFLFDVGLYRALRPRGSLDRPTEEEGPALEGLVVQHIRAWNAYRGERNGLYFWRTRSGVEVDLVVYGEDGLFAIEVKNAARVRDVDLRSLRSFQADYPEATVALIYRGEERLKRDGILCIPCDAFLRSLRPDSNLPVG